MPQHTFDEQIKNTLARLAQGTRATPPAQTGGIIAQLAELNRLPAPLPGSVAQSQGINPAVVRPEAAALKGAINIGQTVQTIRKANKARKTRKSAREIAEALLEGRELPAPKEKKKGFVRKVGRGIKRVFSPPADKRILKGVSRLDPEVPQQKGLLEQIAFGTPTTPITQPTSLSDLLAGANIQGRQASTAKTRKQTEQIGVTTPKAQSAIDLNIARGKTEAAKVKKLLADAEKALKPTAPRGKTPEQVRFSQLNVLADNLNAELRNPNISLDDRERVAARLTEINNELQSAIPLTGGQTPLAGAQIGAFAAEEPGAQRPVPTGQKRADNNNPEFAADRAAVAAEGGTIEEQQAKLEARGWSF